jgi:uncharacterized protein
MPTWMYSRSPDGVCVNLFVGSSVKLDNVMGTTVELTQKTNYPWDGKVAISVTPTATKRFVLRIRSPQRDVSVLYASAPAANGFASIAVNGDRVTPKIENGYAVIDRTWKAGDRVELEIPMTVQRVRAIDRIEADRGKVALRYGPLVYNIEKADVGDISKTLSPEAPLTTEWRGDLLGGVLVIKGTFADGSPLLAIPNYVRMNREPVPPPAPPPAPGAPRPAPPPVVSTVWITERNAH